MIYDPSRHHRRSIRLNGYDYTKAGAYFVTIDVRNWLKLFGRIESGIMLLSEVGLMIQRIWMEIPDYYPGVSIDEFVVMPDHFHGIVVLGDEPLKDMGGVGDEDTRQGQTRGVARTECESSRQQGNEDISRKYDQLSLSEVVQRFKSLTTKKYIDGVYDKSWPRFDGKLWHRNYYEHIIHSQKEWDSIRYYIRSNPRNWIRRRSSP